MRLVSFLAIATCCAYGQNSPVFEAASVKVAQSLGPGVRPGCFGGPGTSDPGLWKCTFAGLDYVIQGAYGLQRFQFVPKDWMNASMFDISAKAPPGTTKPQLLLMEQALLAERFALAVHHEQKEMAGYELGLGKNGTKLKETAPGNDLIQNDPATIPKFTLNADKFPTFGSGRGGRLGLNGRFRWTASNVTIAEILDVLSTHLSRPVTGSEPLPPNIARAVEEQLGLKLKSTRSSVDMIVVDRANKVPTEN